MEATTGSTERTAPELAPSSHSTDAAAAEEALKARLLRKRTKTGCLTCRKRRIKCGEERPICDNCVKSKRHCEGYNQRVIFKTPNIDFRHLQNGGVSMAFQPNAMGMSVPSQGFPIASDPSYAYLRPRPFPPFDTNVQQAAQSAQDYSQWQAQAPAQMHMQQHPPHAMLQTQQHWQTPDHPANRHSIPSHGLQQSFVTTHGPGTMNPNVAASAWHDRSLDHLGQSVAPQFSSHASFETHSSATQQSYPWLDVPITQPTATSTAPPWPLGSYNPREESVQYMDRRDYTGTYLRSSSTDLPQHHKIGPAHAPVWIQDPASSTLQADLIGQNRNLTGLLDEAAIEVQDDDYNDVNSDMDDDIDTPMVSFHRARSSVPIDIVATAKAVSRHRVYVDASTLDAYRPERVASPLKNELTARVFAHFIYVTGPSICTFSKRSQHGAGSAFDGSVPFSQQGMWSESMPMASLHHQGLLQAMLALSSLHIALLNGASTTPSYKHYAYALKRVHHSVGDPEKRRSVPVIAASLLLSYYELWSAEHMKWNSHVAGAKQLIVETQFARMTQKLQRMRKELAYRRQMMISMSTPLLPNAHYIKPSDQMLDQIPDIDSCIVGQFVGRVVDYAEHGGVIDRTGDRQDSLSNFEGEDDKNDFDFARFEQLKELYWLYCRQDVYQSIISGNALMMPFSRWTDCPPRAAMNKADAVHGSWDHLLLLTARIADFAVRDRPRKIKAMLIHGGQWRPITRKHSSSASNTGGAMPASAAHRSSTQSQQSVQSDTSAGMGGPMPQLPPFFGMAPQPVQAGMPAPYKSHRNSSHGSSISGDEPGDVEQALQHATEEWDRIMTALHMYQTLLGSRFQPLSAEHQQPLPSPFGPALFYRTYDIAALWAAYYLTLIVAMRSHPNMPPHASVAAGIAAPDTRQYANEIGRIAAGLVLPPAGDEIHPTLSAPLCDLCVPLFFAGVQYHDTAQRDWTVMRLEDIERRCGFTTARTISSGCQSSWERAYKAGRGPPYVKERRAEALDSRLTGQFESIDMDAAANEHDPTDKRHVRTKPASRLHWAISVLGTEEDL